MELIEGPRVNPVDLTSFVTYLSEADTTPTDAELIEELPAYEMPPALKAFAEGKPLEKPLRRGVGYLRAEAATESETTEEASDFGAGLEADPPSEQEHANPDTNTVTDGSFDTPTVQAQESAEVDVAATSPSAEADTAPSRSRGGKRRRGRRRRGKSRGSDAAAGESAADASALSSSATHQSSTGDDVNPTSGSSADSRNAGTEAGGNRPRRRRNRRRRRGKKPQGGDGQPPQGE